MNKLKSVSVFVFVLLSFSSMAFSATYHVAKTGNDSTGDGSSGLPWLTITYAETQVSAGDTVNIHAGTYSESITTYKDGSAGAYITYQAATGESVTIDGGFYFGYWISRGSTDYNKLIGVTVGEVWLNGNYLELRNCVITDSIDITGHPTATPYASYVTVYGNTFNYDGSDGLKVLISTGTKSSYVTIENNTFADNYNCDVLRIFGHDITIKGNEAYGFNEGGSHADFIQIYDNNGEESYNVILEGNYVHDSTGSIGMILSRNETLRQEGWIWRNNIFVNVDGVLQSTMANAKFYNNTFIECGNNTSGPILLRADYTDGFDSSYYNWPHDVEIKNNIFIGCGSYDTATGNGWYHWASKPDVSTLNFDADYNYTATSKANSYLAKTGFSETHGINGGNPYFTDYDSQNFHLTSSSPSVDAGTTITSFSDDYAGTTRPISSAWDIGAYEYNGSGTTPVVVVSATDDSATESGPTTGTFTLTCTSCSGESIGFSMSGTAISGTDYNLSQSSPVTMNGSDVVITLTPIDDSIDESDETATLTLSSGSGYLVGSPSSGTITITSDDGSVASSGGPILSGGSPILVGGVPVVTQ